ncbi:hypothetical protein DFP79_3146 [Marinomonas balearica]|uniref:Uncharacterized protein n=1 Tax=Marinomonas balearica TaxID=491947 RepID=A0A4R6M5H3_9GAMM|nr:hypothetical protein DFP79_3146 [Marinomonas balearica]
MFVFEPSMPESLPIKHSAIYSSSSVKRIIVTPFAQFMACAEFIGSQVGKGRRQINTIYEDRGYSGSYIIQDIHFITFFPEPSCTTVFPQLPLIREREGTKWFKRLARVGVGRFWLLLVPCICRGFSEEHYVGRRR